ncbi:putative transporter [Lyophyllum shimeji]|uniref:Transporter n=1 Tax=Lyophyllum shimeji TaxID=47721 RepID=A0A9P3PXK7_LYOSH|nr:putative transporter [Lyophyllum shimeji]
MQEETRPDHEIDERPKPERTPLPKFQLLIVFLIQVAEPITATVIYPFVNQFVRDTGITRGTSVKRDIMPASSNLHSLSLRRPRYSNGVARRIASGGDLFFCLGRLGWLSLCWVFNGNIGVSKSVMGEITDSTNVADAFALMPLMWSFGSTAGPIIGGLLARPAETWPEFFGRLLFFQRHPYFLPCAVAALIALISAVIAFVGLKETLPSAVLQEKKRKAAATAVPHASPGPTTGLLLAENGPTYGSVPSSDATVEAGALGEAPEAPPPLRDLLVPRVMTTLLVYSFLAFVDMSCQVLQPLVYSTSTSLGGLGFDPYRIGSIMGTWGVINTIVQLTFLGRIIRKLGARNVQILAQLSYAISLSLYPLLSFLAKRAHGADGLVWTVLVTQLILAMSNNAAYASIGILILDSAPNRAAFGATNGMAQAVGSGMRSIAPSIASSLFSVSLERQLAGGNMVFLVLLVVALIGLRLTFLLPKQATK